MRKNVFILCFRSVMFLFFPIFYGIAVIAQANDLKSFKEIWLTCGDFYDELRR